MAILRKGKQLTTTITLLAPTGAAATTRALTGRHPLSGAKVANLSPAVAQELGADDDSRLGVVVIEVEQRSPAARLGIRRGDIVVGINEEKIDTVAHLEVTLEMPAAARRLAVERAGKVFNLAIQG